ncbi:MAG: ribose-phosphate pyrophosphokinase [Cytophagales bacterium]|nr:ribose-phosphate pyrophosphokinase [Cytophagales bacterium]
MSVKIFSGSYSSVLARDIAKNYGSELGRQTLRRFKDGELSFSFDESIRGDHVFLVQSTCTSAESIVELLLMIDAACRASAMYVTALVPYFGYARQDRKDRPRVSIGAKLIANILSAAGAHRLITMDLHAGQIQGFFDIPVDHLDGKVIFFPYLKKLGLKDISFVAPDVGALPRVREYAQYFGAQMAVCDKYRKVANEVSSIQVIGEVKGRHVILVDDLVDTGVTLCRVSDALMKKGALTVRAFCTHGIFSGDAHQMIDDSPMEEVVITDTIPTGENISSKIHVVSTSALFAGAIKNIENHKSVSSLFLDNLKK